MSLDVYLITHEAETIPAETYVCTEDFVTLETTEYRLVKDTEAIRETGVYSANITHNLGTMAEKARLYEFLWNPNENGIEKASQLIEPLTTGLNALRSNRKYYEQYNPKNGWGSYEGLVRFVVNYLEACGQYPDAKVKVLK